MTGTLYDMTGKHVYLSGPVTGHARNGVVEAFEAARVKCEMCGASYVYSPAEHVRHDAGHEEAMLECLSNLVSRDANDEDAFFDVLVMLDGWHGSNGAQLEIEVARAIGLDCVGVHEMGGGRS